MIQKNGTVTFYKKNGNIVGNFKLPHGLTYIDICKIARKNKLKNWNHFSRHDQKYAMKYADINYFYFVIDLKTGMKVIIDYEVFLVILNAYGYGDVFLSKEGGVYLIDEYSDNLEDSIDDKYDVQAVFKPSDSTDLLSISIYGCEKIWER